MVMRMFVRNSVVNWDEGCSVLVHRKGHDSGGSALSLEAF